MRSIKQISTKQFAIFRIALGIYLTLHFVQLFPYGAELFSDHGMISDACLNPTFQLFPNPLARWDSPEIISVFLLSLIGMSIAFTCGFFRRTTAVLLWFGWACLFNRNNLILNPSIPYVGLMLLLSALIPSGEALSIHERSERWRFPAGIYWVAWFLLATGYTYSGCLKLMSPSWIDGSALLHILNNPLARPGFLRDVLLNLPMDYLRWATWICLDAELLFLPLSFNRVTRMIAWSAMCLTQIAILFVVNFSDLTIAMLLVHLFIFDPDWICSFARGRIVNEVRGIRARLVQT